MAVDVVGEIRRLVLGQHGRRDGQDAGAHAARALGDGLAAAPVGGPRRLGEDRLAVVVQVLEILDRPAVGAAPARSGRPRHGAAADVDGADGRVVAAHEDDGAGGARAHGNALERDTAEVDVDGRETVAAVEEAGRGQAVAVQRRLDEPVQPGAQTADQPLGLVEIMVRPGLDALARGAADARAHLGDDVERALVLARDGLVVALGDDVGERRDLLGDAAAARDEDPAAVGDVAQARARAAAAGAQAQQREDEHEDADRGEHPDPGAAPGARRGGGGGGEGGGGDRRDRKCPRARGARAGAGSPAAVHQPSVGAPPCALVALWRDLTHDSQLLPFLIMRHSCFRLCSH